MVEGIIQGVQVEDPAVTVIAVIAQIVGLIISEIALILIFIYTETFMSGKV